MDIEEAVIAIKPHALRKGIGVGIKIREQYEEAGLEVCGVSYKHLSEKQAKLFYEEHKGKVCFDGLVFAISSGYSMFIHLKGEDAIRKVRNLNDSANFVKAKPGTIRHDFPSAGGPFNLVDWSGNRASFARKKNLVFDD